MARKTTTVAIGRSDSVSSTGTRRYLTSSHSQGQGQSPGETGIVRSTGTGADKAIKPTGQPRRKSLRPGGKCIQYSSVTRFLWEKRMETDDRFDSRPTEMWEGLPISRDASLSLRKMSMARQAIQDTREWWNDISSHLNLEAIDDLDDL